MNLMETVIALFVSVALLLVIIPVYTGLQTGKEQLLILRQQLIERKMEVLTHDITD